jgi:hypothetical protein
MCRHASSFFFVYFTVLVVLVLFPLAATAQTGTEVSDKAFLAVIKARDDKLVFVAELNQIKSYHDKLKSGLGTLFSSLIVSSRETYFKIIDDELNRLKQFEDDIKNASDNGKKNELAKQFGGGYPVVLNDVPQPPNNPIQFASRERLIASGVFQNVVENRQFFEAYQNVFSMMESFYNSARAPLLEQLPKKFNDLASASSSDTLTDSQITSAISKYRDALERTRTSIAPSLLSDLETFRTRVMTPVEALGEDLLKKSADRNSQMAELETSIPLTGKSIYGKTVGAESFNYLLIVFLLVFFVIMIMPRFYPAPVAENVLKSEFLLQFSTVFVLVAAIIILSIGGFIERNQLPVLLAGISGYVLGQLGSNSGRAAVPASAAPPPAGAPFTPPPATPTI